MWVAKTEDEANFIFDLLDDNKSSEPIVKYAQWLESRGKLLAAEFLRLDLSPTENEDRLKELRQQLDARWLGIVTSRRFQRGDVVRITDDLFKGVEGSVVEV